MEFPMSKLPNRELFSLLESSANELKQIASGFPQHSQKHVALRIAGAALVYAITTRSEEFIEFLTNMDSDLTEEEKQSLLNKGITP